MSVKSISIIWSIYHENTEKLLGVTKLKACKNIKYFASKEIFYKEGIIMRCERIDECFFADAFFSTKKDKKSLRDNTCCQFFTTTKYFVFVILNKCEDEVLLDINHFVKDAEALH